MNWNSKKKKMKRRKKERKKEVNHIKSQPCLLDSYVIQPHYTRSKHATTTGRKESCERVSMKSYGDEHVPGAMLVPAYLRYHGHLLLLTLTLVVADLLMALLQPLQLLQMCH
jgi:hypothetical protein